MDEQSKVNSLVNIGQMKVAEKVYDDLISPPAKKVGMALSTILDLGNTVTWPIKWINERTTIYFKNNLKKYDEQLRNIPEDKITEVPSEISMPIIHRFTYVTNEELSNAFVKLLATASSSDTLSKAHPGFIYIIDRLSPDEAKILIFLKGQSSIPCLDVKYHDDPKKTSFLYVALNETGLERKIILDNPLSLKLYFNNLISLGLIALHDNYFEHYEENFEELKDNLKELVNTFKKPEDLIPGNNFVNKIRYEKKMYEVTDYGQLFIEACII